MGFDSSRPAGPAAGRQSGSRACRAARPGSGAALRGGFGRAGLVVLAGAAAKLAPLGAAVALTAYAPAGDAAAFYVAFAYAQTLSFYCHLGSASTALAPLVRAADARPGSGFEPADAAFRILAAAQPIGLPLVAGLGIALLAMAGFTLPQAPVLAAAIVAAYGMAYTQIKATCLLAFRDDLRLARQTVIVAFVGYLPTGLALAAGWTAHLPLALAAGFALPLFWDLARRDWSQPAGSPIGLATVACLRGTGALTLGNGLASLAAVCVVWRVEATLDVTAVVAFGVVQQLRTSLQFFAVQGAPFLQRRVAAHGSQPRVVLFATAAIAALTLLVTLPFLWDEWLFHRVFSGGVPLDGAACWGLGAAALAGAGHCFARALEGAQRYRVILGAWIVFAIVYVGITYAAPATHAWMQGAFFAATALQLACLAAAQGWRPAGNPASRGIAPDRR
jgi:hypothetical protein